VKAEQKMENNEGEEILRRRAANEAYSSTTPEQAVNEDVAAEEELAVSEETADEPADAATQIEALEAEIAKLKETVLRTMAEADNVRKRADRDREDIGKYAVSTFASDMVDVAENLMRASSSIAPEERAASQQMETIAQGVEMTLQLLLGVLEKHGVKRVEPAAGDKFDHNFHQAIAQIMHEGIEPGRVVQVVQAGYVINDRLLRPAMVVVAKAGVEPQPVLDASA
jgi:molecular chaperone GrpE